MTGRSGRLDGQVPADAGDHDDNGRNHAGVTRDHDGEGGGHDGEGGDHDGESRHHEFVADLARLRREAGQPSLRKMSATAHYSHTALAGVLSGARLPSLELTMAFVRACGGDEAAWRARWHREAGSGPQQPGPEPAGSQPAGLQQPGSQPATAESPGDSTPRRPVTRRPAVPRWALAATAGLTVLLAGSIVPLLVDARSHPNRQAERPVDTSLPAPAAAPPTDGADPQEERCQVDAVSAETVPVPDPDPKQPPYGSLTLRYSPRCRAAWPLFVSTERVPTGSTVRLSATRPSDGAVTRFDYPFMVKRQVYSVFGNILRTTPGCVSVTVDITAADNRSVLASARTPCVRPDART
ncbi:DUF2690 domain-containing protein [Micromonospora sp. RL09-050-HVF-A]|uniref:DUF2690 domain-containing protein n=1 Tax=Micromonospora sp. RL09-050-HVF-A TaxID=1703433 RepID=UPI001C606CE4|nr:DUF2690 domain-containing protein [Micromonospora sp. RL09-050-HVF-A]MBW4704072.1 DUF2690 domain-containing protein [Micromonospora sp. RL09-050-HVF-A]